MMKKFLFVFVALTLVFVSGVSVSAASTVISEDRAKEIVINDAGVNIDEVVFTKVKLDEKTSVYEIKFTCNKDKYEYEISIKDGSILSKEWDIKESTSQPTRPDESAKPDYSAVLAQAEEVALSTAGIDRAVCKRKEN